MWEELFQAESCAALAVHLLLEANYPETNIPLKRKINLKWLWNVFIFLPSGLKSWEMINNNLSTI